MELGFLFLFLDRQLDNVSSDIISGTERKLVPTVSRNGEFIPRVPKPSHSFMYTLISLQVQNGSVLSDLSLLLSYSKNTSPVPNFDINVLSFQL